MGKFRLKRPSTGTVLGFIAIIIAVVGTANAAPRVQLIQKGDIAPGAVTAKALAPNAVHAKALAANAVTSKKLAKGAVNKRVLAKAAVTAASISPNAVTSAALAPGSVYGGSLGEQTIQRTPIADVDQVAENGTWTAGNTEIAVCGPGEKLLSVGFAFPEPGNKEVTFLQAMPFISPNNNGASGRFASNSGGSAKGEIIAVCLK
ncbi:MAG: hypothetical protein AB7T48_06670 [Solirubrobacterales bacterium]